MLSSTIKRKLIIWQAWPEEDGWNILEACMVLQKDEDMKKHRIMFVTHDLAIGGLQQVVVNLCRTIDKGVFEPSVLCLRSRGGFADEVEEMGIRVFLLPSKGGRVDYVPYFRIARIFREEGIGIIHTHNTQPFVDGTFGALLAGVRTIVHTDHARDFPDKKRYMFLEWLVSHFAYRVVGVSDHTTRNLIRYEKISAKKTMTIMNGIYGEKYRISIDTIKKKMELGIRHDGPVIGLGVRLSEQKGITYLLQAMPDILKGFPELTLLIAGEGQLEDQLKTEAKDRGISDHVIFAGPRLDMPEILKVLDLYVLPSLWEGLPMVLLEAMAAECPIVATDVGGNSMAIQNGVNGILVPAKSSVELAKAVIGLLSDEQTRHAFIQKGREIFDKKFSARIMTANYEQIYLRRELSF
ncbi:MAG TPA: glycosyltransferase [Syntrophorhabdus sp.]|nr:glycosyltransferase [Syntrophorhabdus sp.]